MCSNEETNFYIFDLQVNIRQIFIDSFNTINNYILMNFPPKIW